MFSLSASRNNLLFESRRSIAITMEVTKREDGVFAAQYPFSESYCRISKHRSCWVHTVAALYARGTRITKQQAEELRSFQLTSPCSLGTFPSRVRSKRRNKYRSVIRVKEKLDSAEFECYLDHLRRNLPKEKRASITCLSSLWFSLYMKESFKEKVLAWIKNEKIFSKKYVMVPIVYWSHWNLLIICNLGKSFQSKAAPCLLLLDSLEMANPRRLEPDIRRFLLDIYRSEGRTENENWISKIPFFVPEVPQQRNDKECGHYVLCFINLFMRDAPENFTIEGYPYFMKQNWFSLDCVGQLYEKLKTSRK